MKRRMVILFITVCLVVAGSVFANPAGEQPAPANGTEVPTGDTAYALTISEQGRYGPTEGVLTVMGDAIVTSAGVTLENTVIVGNLYLDESIAEGIVELVNVTVTGSLYVQGGGEQSVTISDSQINHLEVNRPGQVVKILAQGASSVWSTRVQSSARLEEKLTDGIGFHHVYHTGKSELILSGDFQTLSIEDGDGSTMLSAGKIAKIYIESKAVNTVLYLESSTAINLLELYATANVTGKGTVGTAIVGAKGAVLEMIPSAFQFGNEVTVTVAGKEVNKVTAEELLASLRKPPEPEKPPEPVLPSIKLQKIEGLTLDAGKSGTREMKANPSDAEFKVTSGNTKVAAVSLSGNDITVTAKSAGTAKITVTAAKTGYSKAGTSFTVTVKAPPAPPNPNQVNFTFKAEASPVDPSKKLVVVVLLVNDPLNYTVKMTDGTVLKHRFDNVFSEEVKNEIAIKANVRITKN